MLIYLNMIETDENRSKFEQVYIQYRDLMYYIAYRRLHHIQDAEDAVHHAFVKIAENIKIIEPPCAKTKQLVVTIVDNHVTDLLRAKGRHPEIELVESGQESENVEDMAIDLLSQSILLLPEKQRNVIWLKYHHGYSLREISKLLDISLADAQKTDQRAKAKLEQIYKERGGTL